MVWVYTGEINAKRIRERYLQSVLRQDIAFFDKIGAGEVATRIETDCRKCSLSGGPGDITFILFVDLVQQGISDKVPLMAYSVASVITGFTLAYAKSWRLALAISVMVPCVVISGHVMHKVVSKYMQYVSDSVL